MKNLVITIAREFGSGGREIAHKLSEKLKIKYYDKELISLAAQKSGMDEELFEKADEKNIDSFWYTYAMGAYAYSDHVLTGMPVNDKLYMIQSNIIKDLASRESCIIVGRCSNYILKEKAIKIYLYADDSFKLERIKRLYQLTEKEAKAIISKADKKRADYYNYYTESKWGDKSNYDIMINTSSFGIENTVSLIAKYIETKR